MRALYQYHTVSRDWGDVGYNFVIGRAGQIFEGRAGGKGVVGGHAYCYNRQGLGIALRGNFEKNKPTQAQMKSLQWLLKKLSSDYNISPHATISHHGKRLKTIIGHNQVQSTACPGYFIDKTLDQVRRNVRTNRVNQSIRFPAGGRVARTARGAIPWYSQAKGVNLTPLGSTDITGPPGSQVMLSIILRAGNTPISKRDRIAQVIRSNTSIGLWQVSGGRELRVRRELLSPTNLRANGSTALQIRLQLPNDRGIYTLKIDDIAYVLKTKGRSVSTTSLGSGETNRLSRRSVAGRTPTRRRTNLVRRSSTSRYARSSAGDDTIRIRLGYPNDSALVKFGRNTQVNDATSTRYQVRLSQSGDDCVATEYGKTLARGIVRISPSNGYSTIESWLRDANMFEGILECRIVDGEFTLIVEHANVDEYLRGLAEQPDNQPYQKQRAIAIAARSYAAYYMDPTHHKFPGKPYDGDDSPARFQKYIGKRFADLNPNWIRAVESTAMTVVKKGGLIVKTPYFSSDPGYTKTPAEAGWGTNFPFAEVFSSKLDPWCEGLAWAGHGVGMSGCGSKAQALAGKTAEQILEYYYPTTELQRIWWCVLHAMLLCIPW